MSRRANTWYQLISQDHTVSRHGSDRRRPHVRAHSCTAGPAQRAHLQDSALVVPHRREPQLRRLDGAGRVICGVQLHAVLLGPFLRVEVLSARFNFFPASVFKSAAGGRTLMAALRAKFGVSSKWRRRKLVSGHVLLPCASQRVMLLRS